MFSSLRSATLAGAAFFSQYYSRSQQAGIVDIRVFLQNDPQAMAALDQFSQAQKIAAKREETQALERANALRDARLRQWEILKDKAGGEGEIKEAAELTQGMRALYRQLGHDTALSALRLGVGTTNADADDQAYKDLGFDNSRRYEFSLNQGHRLFPLVEAAILRGCCRGDSPEEGWIFPLDAAQFQLRAVPEEGLFRKEPVMEHVRVRGIPGWSAVYEERLKCDAEGNPQVKKTLMVADGLILERLNGEQWIFPKELLVRHFADGEESFESMLGRYMRQRDLATDFAAYQSFDPVWEDKSSGIRREKRLELMGADSSLCPTLDWLKDCTTRSYEGEPQKRAAALAIMRAEMLDHLSAAQDAMRRLQLLASALEGVSLKPYTGDPRSVEMDWSQVEEAMARVVDHPLLGAGVPDNLQAFLSRKGGAVVSIQAALDKALDLAERLYGRRSLEAAWWAGDYSQKGHTRFLETYHQALALQVKLENQFKQLGDLPLQSGVPALPQLRQHREKQVRARALEIYEQEITAVASRPSSPTVSSDPDSTRVLHPSTEGRPDPLLYQVNGEGHQQFQAVDYKRQDIGPEASQTTSLAEMQRVLFDSASFMRLRARLAGLQDQHEGRLNRVHAHGVCDPRNTNYDILGRAKADALWKRCEKIAEAKTPEALRQALKLAGFSEETGRVHLEEIRFQVKLLNQEGVYGELLSVDCQQHRHSSFMNVDGQHYVASNGWGTRGLFSCRGPATTRAFVEFILEAHRRLQSFEKERLQYSSSPHKG